MVPSTLITHSLLSLNIKSVTTTANKHPKDQRRSDLMHSFGRVCVCVCVCVCVEGGGLRKRRGWRQTERDRDRERQRQRETETERQRLTELFQSDEKRTSIYFYVNLILILK